MQASCGSDSEPSRHSSGNRIDGPRAAQYISALEASMCLVVAACLCQRWSQVRMLAHAETRQSHQDGRRSCCIDDRASAHSSSCVGDCLQVPDLGRFVVQPAKDRWAEQQPSVQVPSSMSRQVCSSSSRRYHPRVQDPQACRSCRSNSLDRPSHRSKAKVDEGRNQPDCDTSSSDLEDGHIGMSLDAHCLQQHGSCSGQ